jgi:tetratricopeptide (TPR) repeat protein
MRRAVSISVVLALTTLASYAPVLRNDFLNYDDPEYVTDNAIVKKGLTLDGVRWAFIDSVGYASNWHPLTWLSHMLDCQLFDLRAATHHLTSVVIHAISVVLLFLTLRRMTGADWQSAFVAGVFALHPSHVQSVAWAAERKDVLATAFWMLTMWCYARYAERPTAARYALVAAALVLGLLSKPMLVTLPFALLLLDYWPLRRVPPFRRAILEKVPLLAMCAGAMALTYLAQSRAGAVLSDTALPLSDRVSNAIVSYVRYLGKFFWPERLAVFYPYEQWSLPTVGASAALLLAITLAAIAIRRRAPYFVVGWLWFLGTLVPVIGLVQIGRQSMADRYMHVPMIGLAMIIAWGARDLVRERPPTVILRAVAFILLIASAARTVVEIGYWRDSETLFRRAIAVTGDDNAVAHNNLGTALAMRGDVSGAAVEFRQVLRLAPNDAGAHRNLARALAQMGDVDGAIVELRESLRLNESAFDQNLVGRMLLSRGRREEAIAYLARAAQLEPSNAKYAADLAAAR